ncbi:hypothetical protein ACGFNU_33360 [Spirillospora sp. NPDC048911]|uniref:hypothetical protein n=1 Tax=Spirillospora sp. NPDC048911 TaxID=3364527 RepID=UPI0037173A53
MWGFINARLRGSGLLLLPAVAAAPLLATSSSALAAPTGCTNKVGDVAVLAEAFRAGGDHQLGKDCVYTLSKRAGKDSILPAITKNTTIDGNGASIVWSGRDSVPMLDIGAGVRLRLADVTVVTRGRAATTPSFHMEPGATLLLTNGDLAVRLHRPGPVTTPDKSSDTSSAHTVGSCEATVITTFNASPRQITSDLAVPKVINPDPLDELSSARTATSAPVVTHGSPCEESSSKSVTELATSAGTTRQTACCTTSAH